MKPGRELDALVAEKVMGRSRKCSGDWIGNALGGMNEPAGWCGGCGMEDPPKGEHERIIPEYSTDIAAAWEVVEHMKRMRKSSLLMWIGYGGCSNVAGFRYKGDFDEMPFPENDLHAKEYTKPGEYFIHRGELCTFVESDSVPIAICLAALDAVGVEI